MKTTRRFILLVWLVFLLSACERPAATPSINRTPIIVTQVVIGGASPGGAQRDITPGGTPLPPLTGRSPLDPPKGVQLWKPKVELPMLDIHGLPAVEVMIDGSGPYPFIIDWGANIFAMSPAIAKDLGLPVLGMDMMGNANAQVKELSIGEVQFQNLTAVLDPFFDQTGEAGVLGRNVYQSLQMTLDYPNRLVRLAEGRLPPADGRSIITYTPSEGGAPMLEMNLQDQQFLAVLDTGASRGLILPADEANNFKFVTGPVSSGIAIGPQLGAAKSQVGRLAGDLQFGGFTVTQPVAVIIDRPEFLLGGRILGHFALTLDQLEQRVRLELEGTAPITMPVEQWEQELPSP